MKRIYLDNSATTPIDNRVLKEICRNMKKFFGNPGSLHAEGVLAKEALEKARREVASFFGATTGEVIFTSGGTESNNLAILGSSEIVSALLDKSIGAKPARAIFLKTGHSSILSPAENLSSRGIKVDWLSVDSDGLVDLDHLRDLLTPETFLVSIEYANNETGVIQPVRQIARIIRDFYEIRKKTKTDNSVCVSLCSFGRPIFHVDASQAPGYLNCDANYLGADMISIDGQKIYGPKGVGALYIRRGVKLAPIFFGGGQEKRLRPGTENVPFVIGLATALRICVKNRNDESARLTAIRDWLIAEIFKITPSGSVLNGHPKKRLPNNINFSLPGVNTEFLLFQLDADGVSVSTRSACLSGADSSHAVAALGGPDWKKKNTIRISLGRFTKKSDCKKLLQLLRKYL